MTFGSRIFATITLLLSLLSATAFAQQDVWRPHLYGCLHNRNTVDEINMKDYLVRTGNAALDADLEEDIARLDSVFGVHVSVYFPNDGLQDARFTTETNATLMTRDDVPPSEQAQMSGSIFISRGLFEEEFQRYGTLMSIPGILAHEYAHAMQARYGFPYGKGIQRELHADFMSGWYTAYRCNCRQQDPRPALDAIARRGDNRGFFDPNSHGTNEQRAAFWMAGYNYFRQTGSDAMSAYQYALRLVS
jgi:hypothetical protein